MIYERDLTKARGMETAEEAGRRLFKFQDLSNRGVLDRKGFFAVMRLLGTDPERRLLGQLFDRHSVEGNVLAANNVPLPAVFSIAGTAE